MKTQIKRSSYLSLMFVLLFVSCKKDDPKPAALDLSGTWEITTAFGTEWEKTAGIVTPKAADPEAVGAELVIVANTMEYIDANGVSKGTGTLVYTADKVTLTFGSDVLEFALEDKTATGMQWNQREPNTESDYEFNSGGNNYLYFQKFWTLTKQ